MFFSLNSDILDLHSQKQIRLKPLVSIVILNFNGVKYLQEFLPTVLATQYENFEVVVADNGSTDNSLSFLQNNFLRTVIILCNYAIKILILLNFFQFRDDFFIIIFSVQKWNFYNFFPISGRF